MKEFSECARMQKLCIIDISDQAKPMQWKCVEPLVGCLHGQCVPLVLLKWTVRDTVELDGRKLKMKLVGNFVIEKLLGDNCMVKNIEG